MKYIYIIAIFSSLLAAMSSCKKEAPLVVSIVGKWYITKQQSQLSYNGALLETYIDTNFTPNDFVEYYSDGSGYFSQNSAPSPSITEFTYTLSGTALTQHLSGGGPLPETIVVLTSNNLSIQAKSLVQDPNNSGQTDNELDNYSYTRAN